MKPSKKSSSSPTAAAAKAEASPAKGKKSGGSSTTLLLSLSAVAVAVAAVGAGQFGGVDGDVLVQHLPYPVASGVSKVVNVVNGKGAVLGNFDMPNKYKTDLVHVDVRHLASGDKCVDAEYNPQILGDGKLVHVKQAMAESSAASDKVFFMLNGQNEGLYVSWNGQFDCIAQAAEFAAVSLGADRDVMENGVRLYSQMGFPVRNAQDLATTKNLVHVLLDFQLWVWPGIEKGYQYTLENGVMLTTVGMNPKVFDVVNVISDTEAKQVMALGIPGLDRSKVDGSNSSKVVSGSRTSHTAFVDDGAFTRAFRHRSAQVARLPSPTYAERLQLVRYAAGEFYRQHLDTFHSREFLPAGSNEYTYEDYETWANWAAGKLRELDQSILPEEFREGGTLFPNAEDEKMFPNALLGLFYKEMNESNMFTALYDEEWSKWIRDNVAKNAQLLMPVLLKEGNRRKYLPMIVKEWEKKLGRPELHYTFPKHEVNSVSHFFYWVRWAKERVSFLGNKVPATARPDGQLYPKFTVAFQEKLLGFILDDYSQKFLTRLTNVEWYAWMVENRGRNHVLFGVMQAFPTFAELAIRTWERRVGSDDLHYKMPRYVKHFHPQRFVTLFLYLNNQTKIGGETVFPYSLDRYSDETIKRNGMDECSTGLAVPPRGLHASLFYVQTPEGDVDQMSRHGGCPPHEGIKWGSNSFMWDSDADEGADLWTTK
uniref:Prolyl 4-hydroxylase alpha subunit domain-containing protein n=1 Tax=Globisporangium ultimum (strain ATCC 200006 / CBS 805.95 / DAOM BR144) TaxID=431595 RepID=K3X6I2_GLOUD